MASTPAGRRSSVPSSRRAGGGAPRCSREHVQVVEVSASDCFVRRSRGKDDAAMAHKDARSEVWCATLKGRDDMVESLRVLTRARASALKARKAAIEQIRSLIVSAPTPCATSSAR